MLGVKPSYSSGYAVWPWMSEYPHLWQGLVAAWDPSLGVTGTVFDFSGNGHSGVLVGTAQFASGIFGSAILLDGDSDYINFGDIVASFGWGSAFTIVAGINGTTPTGDPSQILGIDGDGQRVLQFRLDATGEVRLIRFDIDEGVLANFTSTGTADDGNFHQVGATFSSAVGSKIWIDGAVDGTDADTEAQSSIAGEPVLIGARDPDSITDFFNGKIHYLMIYNRALIASEIAQLYHIRKRLA